MSGPGSMGGYSNPGSNSGGMPQQMQQGHMMYQPGASRSGHMGMPMQPGMQMQNYGAPMPMPTNPMHYHQPPMMGQPAPQSNPNLSSALGAPQQPRSPIVVNMGGPGGPRSVPSGTTAMNVQRGPHSVQSIHASGPLSVGGPQSVGTHGPQSVGPHGPHSVGGPQSMGPQSVGPRSVGPQSVDPHSVGPQSVGPHSVGPQSVGPQSVPLQGPSSVPPGSMPEGPSSQYAAPHSMNPGSQFLLAGPQSVNPSTPINPSSQLNVSHTTPGSVLAPGSQQMMSSQQTPGSQSAPSAPPPTASPASAFDLSPADPLTSARNLMLKDLRTSLVNFNKCAAESLRSRGDADGVTSTNYNNALNDFLAICDRVDMHLTTVIEANRQMNRLEKCAPEKPVQGDSAVPWSNVENLNQTTERLMGLFDNAIASMMKTDEKLTAREAKSETMDYDY